MMVIMAMRTIVMRKMMRDDNDDNVDDIMMIEVMIMIMVVFVSIYGLINLFYSTIYFLKRKS